MKAPAIVFLAVILSVGFSFAAVTIFQSDEGEKSATPGEFAALNRRMEKISASNAALAESLQDLRTKLDSVSLGAPRISQKEIDEAVARWLKAHPREYAGSHGMLQPELTKVAAMPASSINLEDTLDQLYSNRTYEEKEKIWVKVRDAGLLDEAVAAFEKRAEENSNNPDFQVDLAEAYLQKLFTVPEGPERGIWGIKADRAYDAALAINDHHWEARFSKAISLSFWPPIFGKQNEAINHFETLIRQQEETSSEPQFAQTYLLLGNLYQQQGKMEKAEGVWKQGLEFFPDDKGLGSRVSELEAR